ncbi:hypothetical protein GUITHDRAFT_153572, partial [Guillardia theta CCMP2712]
MARIQVAVVFLSCVCAVSSFHSLPSLGTPLGRIRTGRTMQVRMMSASGEEIPEAVIEAERKATPLRPVRLQLYTVIGGAAAAAPVLLLSSEQLQVKALKDLADNIPILYSAQVTAALSAIVAFSCAFFYISEEQTRKENLQRIMARLE